MLGRRVTSIHRAAEKAHSRKLTVASPHINIPFIAVRALSPHISASSWRDIDTSAARICYEELQVVTAQLPENQSCVALPVLRARQATQDKSARYGSNSGHFRKPGLRHTQFSETDLTE